MSSLDFLFFYFCTMLLFAGPKKINKKDYGRFGKYMYKAQVRNAYLNKRRLGLASNLKACGGLRIM